MNHFLLLFSLIATQKEEQNVREELKIKRHGELKGTY